MNDNNFNIYCAGPMEGLTVRDMQGWRNHLANYFIGTSIKMIDPTRRIPFHEQVHGIDGEARQRNVCQRVFHQDLMDIDSCSLLVANVRQDAGRGVGTNMEVMYCWMKRIPIILIVDEKDPIHPFYESMYTEKCFNVDDAAHAIKSYAGYL